MKILLVDPPVDQYFTPFKEGPALALGLLSIDSYLGKHGYRDNELDNYFACDWPEIEARLRRAQPDIIGIGCTTDSRGFCWRLAQAAKSINPQCKVVLGNVHATFFPREILEHYPVDFCVLSEGEETMLELVRALEAGRDDFSGILGLAYRDPRTGEVRQNERRPLLKDLDEIPISPKRRLFVNETGRRQGNMMSSRGCPFACGFCSSSSFWGRTWRKRRPEKVLEEFEMLKAQGAEVIDMLDDLFTMDLERAETICDLLIARGNRTPWFARARVDRITERLVDKMIAAGCAEISFGVESGDPEMIERINKKIDLEQAAEVFRMLRHKRLIARANFMVGNPGETAASVDASIRVACRMDPTSLIASIARVYPNTMLDVEAQKHGLINREFWYLKSDEVPYYTVDMPFEQLQAHATRMMFHWARNRGPLALAKMAYVNWRLSGTRRSLSFVFSWIRSWFPRGAGPAPTG
jgi:radical SAM superfamily enzyme YgiQ (UPF0313 family)